MEGLGTSSLSFYMFFLQAIKRISGPDETSELGMWDAGYQMSCSLNSVKGVYGGIYRGAL